jgi:protein ImuB
VQAHQAFEYGIDRLEVLHQVLEQLTESIAASLLRMNRGARQVECRLHHERAEPVRLVVGLSRPRRSAPYLGMLLRTQLERVQLAEPVVAVSLHAVMVEPLADNQHDLFETERAHEEELSALIDRLSNRLGPEAVTRPLLLADAQPEYACRFEPVVPARHEQQAAPGKEKARPRRKAKRAAAPPLFTPDAGHRPLRLWPRPALIQVLAMLGEVPLKFRWQGEEHRIVRLWGPERIATGWWRGQDVQRDYYIVATQRGPRFWIFRQPQDGRWFLHGCFD